MNYELRCLNQKIYLNGHLSYNTTTNTLSDAAGRALASIIAKYKNLNNVGFNTFSKLYHNEVDPVKDYLSGI